MKKPDDLKIVLLYTERDKTFTVLEHNLEPEEAETRTAALRNERLPTFAVLQTKRHREAEVMHCRACTRDVRYAYWPHKGWRTLKRITESAHYAVLTKERRGNTFAPAAHNLSVERADAKVLELRDQNTKAYFILQERFHDGELDACKFCQGAAQCFSQRDRRHSFWKKIPTNQEKEAKVLTIENPTT